MQSCLRGLRTSPLVLAFLVVAFVQAPPIRAAPTGPVRLSGHTIKITPLATGATAIDVETTATTVTVFYNADTFTFPAKKVKSVEIDASCTANGSEVALFMGADLDTAYYGGSATNFITFADGDNLFVGGRGDSFIGLGDDENLVELGRGAAVITGGSGRDWVLGGRGDLTLNLGSGQSFVVAGCGANFISAQNGGRGIIIADEDDPDTFLALDTGNYCVIDPWWWFCCH